LVRIDDSSIDNNPFDLAELVAEDIFALNFDVKNVAVSNPDLDRFNAFID